MALITAHKIVRFHEKTEVQMANLPSDVIDAYVDTGEPM
jgi:predicted house-cleaning NTP pyrophosphatase (Maf/HAM1 superfamily)